MSLRYMERGRLRTRWEVTSGRLVIGSIRQNLTGKLLGHRVTWIWVISLTVGPRGFRRRGRSKSFEEAKAKVDAHWREWLRLAELQARE
jgi:hypothetical protein